MTEPGRGFYVTGGSLRTDAASYVPRDADADLLAALQRGEFCYILTPRQMGKSSLMARTSARLRSDGVRVVILDFTANGQNLTVEQWYYGLLGRVGEQLGLEDELDAFWLDNERMGPLRRFMSAFQQIVLPRCCGQIVVFIDEIDVVRSLPFSTDEFFAAIRECYNRRVEDSEFDRLTFCLLGVASPSDLIRDTRLTPFNIGRRIELNDFTAAEAEPLAEGLDPPMAQMTADTETAENPQITQISQILQKGAPNSNAKSQAQNRKLLARILYWSGGHPYLTQRLCMAVVMSTQTGSLPAPACDLRHPTPRDIDRICSDLFLSHRAQERDDNLVFVRERLLRTEGDKAALLTLYAGVWRGKRVVDDDTNELIGQLRLAGIVRVRDGRLQVRNRIYERVFGRTWIEYHMPDAELRRQREAYRRGLFRALALSTGVVAVVAGLAITAGVNLARANANAIVAFKRDKESSRNLYVADMNLACQALDIFNLRGARELLEKHRPRSGQPEDLRGFEWRHLWARCRGNQLRFFRAAGARAAAVAMSPNGRFLSAGSDDGMIRKWDLVSRTMVGEWKAHTPAKETNGAVLVYSSKGSLLVSAGWDGIVKVWDAQTDALIAELAADKTVANDVAFSPDDRSLITSGQDGYVRIWDIASGSQNSWFAAHAPSVYCARFSPDGRLIATGGSDGYAKLWSASTHQLIRSLRGAVGSIFSVAFSPDNRTVALGEYANGLKLWNAADGSVRTLRGHTGGVNAVLFSPNGKLLASGSSDGTVRLWDTQSWQTVRTLLGHTKALEAMDFSRDGTRMATASDDGTVGVWDTAPDRDEMRPQPRTMFGLAMSPNGKLAATGCEDNKKKLIDIASRKVVATLVGKTDVSQSVAFSPNGALLAAATGRYSAANVPCPIELWDVASRKLVTQLLGHAGAVMCVNFSPNGLLLASSGNDGFVKVWDVPHRRLSFSLPAEKDWQCQAVFSPDSRKIAVAGSGMKRIDLWDVATRTTVSIPASSMGTNSPAFSPDGRLLAFGDSDGIHVVELATMRLRPPLQGHVGDITGLAFSPDSKTLASSGSDETARLWNLTTMAEVWTFRGHDADVTSIAFSASGNLLAAGSSDGTLRFWEAAPFSVTDSVPAPTP